MSCLDDILRKLGAIYQRAHLFNYQKTSAPGVSVSFTRDLRPIGSAGLDGGHLVELLCVLDDRHKLSAASRIRLDILEQDFLLTGGLDDQVLSLLGTDAVAPETGFTTQQCDTVFHELDDDADLHRYIDGYRRQFSGDDGLYPTFEKTILVLARPGVQDGQASGTRQTVVIAWWRATQVEDNDDESELYFVLDVDGSLNAASPVLRVRKSPAGVAIRVRGRLIDAQPLNAAAEEPLPDIPVVLDRRTSVTDDDGAFEIDARLLPGEHPMTVRRPGIDPVELRVKVGQASDGVVKVEITTPTGADIAMASTAGPADESSLLKLVLVNPLQVRVHKLRGIVRWPDSRPGSSNEPPIPAVYVPMPADYRGTPIAERRIYVLPLPANGLLGSYRPRTTRDWEALKRRPEVLRSSRPGRPLARERTDGSGAFEVKYVDLTQGNRFLMWVERFDPRSGNDLTTETPDQVVRCLQRQLMELHEAQLSDTGRCDHFIRRNRNLVDHEYNLTRDPVAWGLDAIRIVDIAGARTFVRPSRATRAVPAAGAAAAIGDRFEDAVIGQGVGEQFPVTPSRIVEGLDLRALPLVWLGETGDARGAAATRMVERLATSAALSFPGGFDASSVTWALDLARLDKATDFGAAGWDAPTVDARRVEWLERTFVVRPELGRGRRLQVDDAHWQMDAISLADTAFIGIPAGAGNDFIANRHFLSDVAPLFSSVTPLLPALAPRCIYLAPGHGLFPVNNAHASTAPANWRSLRGGYAMNAGEDETDQMLSRGIESIIRQNAGRVFSSRELEDLVAPGFINPQAGQYVAAANVDFPRLWQQNALYHLRIGAAGAPAAGDFSALEINARANDIEHRIAVSGVNAVLATHTNAGRGRGTMAEYLNVQPTTVNAGEGNPLGLSFATKVLTRLRQRSGLRRYPVTSLIDQDNVDQLETPTHPYQRPAVPTYPPPLGFESGLRTMNNINPEAVRDLFGNFDHWVRNTQGAPNITRLRSAVAPVGAPGLWTHNATQAGRNVPVVLVELAFHDQSDDASFLSRTWFRRSAAEGMAEAIDDQMRASPDAISGDDARLVLVRLVGDAQVLNPLSGAAPVSVPDLQAALRRAVDPNATVAANTLDALVVAGSRSLGTRRELVDSLAEALRPLAGYAAGDAAIDRFIVGPMIGAKGVADLPRPADAPTRAEAAAMVCRAVGARPIALSTAEGARADGGPALMRPAPASPANATVYFPPVERALLVQRVGALRPTDIFHVEAAFLADTRWRRLGASPTGTTQSIDASTPVVVVVETAGTAWQATVDDVMIEIAVGGVPRRLACAVRQPGLLVSATWIVDLLPTQRPVAINVTTRVRHPTQGWLIVGVNSLDVQVVGPV